MLGRRSLTAGGEVSMAHCHPESLFILVCSNLAREKQPLIIKPIHVLHKQNTLTQTNRVEPANPENVVV